MGTVGSQNTSLTIVYSTVYSGEYKRKHQSSASLAFVRGIHRWPVDSPHKGPVTRKMFPFDDVVMQIGIRESTITAPVINNLVGFNIRQKIYSITHETATLQRPKDIGYFVIRKGLFVHGGFILRQPHRTMVYFSLLFAHIIMMSREHHCASTGNATVCSEAYSS